MKETRNHLMAIMVFAIVFALGVVALFETDTMTAGLYTGETQSEFFWTAFMELHTLGCVFLGLRLFKFKTVHADLVSRKHAALSAWGALRLVMLLAPMVANTYLYYLFMNTTFGYMAIIGLLCIPFVFPTLSRCEAEVEDDK
jgi:hypothetical protein